MNEEQMTINEEEAPFIPGEIIANILVCLPVKSLKRFQCVCKQWNNLIKTPSFIQHHLRHSTHHNSSLVLGPAYSNDYHLLSFYCDLKFREFENFPCSLRGLCLVGSSNGLLCFVEWNQRPSTLLLWNPATREERQIPIMCTAEYPYIFWRFGFGFSPISNDYKIVILSSTGMPNSIVEVFSLSTGCWRRIISANITYLRIVSHYFYGLNNHGVTAGGVLFWRAMRKNDTTPVIVSFDLALEVLTVLQWPAFASHYGKLGVYDDKLAIITYPKVIAFQNHYGAMEENVTSIHFEVLEEETIGSSRKRWSSSKKYFGNFDVVVPDGTIWRNKIVAIGYRTPPHTEHAVEANVSLYLIDVNADECQQFVLPTPRSGLGVCVFNYVESLVPLRGNIQIEELNE